MRNQLKPFVARVLYSKNYQIKPKLIKPEKVFLSQHPIIKEALTDPDAILKIGWNAKKKTYENSRRVTLVKGNYIVVIVIFADKKAREK